MITMYYFSETAKLNFKLWDIETLTAGDFGVEMRITEN